MEISGVQLRFRNAAEGNGVVRIDRDDCISVPIVLSGV
jgi:hypothetical protein